MSRAGLILAALVLAALMMAAGLAAPVGAQQSAGAAKPRTIAADGVETLYYASRNAGIDVVATLIVCAQRINDADLAVLIDAAPTARATVKPGDCVAVTGLEVAVRNTSETRQQNLTFEIVATFSGF